MRTLLLMTLLGCADPIGHAPPDASVVPGDTGGDAAPTGKVRTTHNADGTFTALVDSSSMTDWTYADLETGTAVDVTAGWQLRFQRFHISTNAGVAVAPLAGTSFAAVTTAPASGYISDVEGMYAFDQGDSWYDYNGDTHVLTPKPLVWVIKTTGSTLKLEILKYYDTAGNAGWFTLHWGAL